jgi:hypothetical protein
MSLALATKPAARELVRAETLYLSGNIADAQRLAEHVVSVSRDAGDGMLGARAEYDRSMVLSTRGHGEEGLEHGLRAVARAESVGADHLGGLPAVHTAIILRNLHRNKEWLSWAYLARGKLARLGSDETLEFAVVHEEALEAAYRDPHVCARNERTRSISGAIPRVPSKGLGGMGMG